MIVHATKRSATMCMPSCPLLLERNALKIVNYTKSAANKYAPSDSLHVSECCCLPFPKCPSVCCSCDDSDHDVHYFSTGVLVCVHPKGVLHAFTSSYFLFCKHSMFGIKELSWWRLPPIYTAFGSC